MRGPLTPHPSSASSVPETRDTDTSPRGQQSYTEKEIYQYDAPWPIYALDWSKVPTERAGFRLALGSLIEEHSNKLQIVTRSDLAIWDDVDRYKYYGNNAHPPPDFLPLAEVDTHYPVTKLLWEPHKPSSRHNDILVSSSDVLRVWELKDNPSYARYGSTIGGRRTYGDTNGSTSADLKQSLVKRSELVNMKQRDFCAPLTSFDWNQVDPSLIVTASIDTTCTVWNVETGQAKTQLIAHDRDVYDVAFMHGTSDIFASVGADGSVRLFDLRSLEHSTILYEAPPTPSSPSGSFASVISDGSRPLLRLQFNPIHHELIATFHMDSDTVQILDIRFPSAPIAELTRSHQSSVNCFSWSSAHPGFICTGGDDSQVLVWDINQQQQPSQPLRRSSRQAPTPQNVVQSPSLRYVADSEVKSLSWSQSLPTWISVAYGRTVQALRV
ncbi:WD40-repeat-containing domain protein [Syncephalastrum racemosum]|uniref:WD40-repeat-containing domain protein n=1 Tax=Syncephalastrum racemosum TaxID=13706 RepID=A0A1X2HAH3_SYNRA|nr:WD40-repeat-containing domain protein [Syncephalastrum racemosum]